MEIKKGDTFKCIKDLVDGVSICCKGLVYQYRGNGLFVDEQGHFKLVPIDPSIYDEYFEPYDYNYENCGEARYFIGDDGVIQAAYIPFIKANVMEEKDKINYLRLILEEWEPKDVADMIVEEYKAAINYEDKK